MKEQQECTDWERTHSDQIIGWSSEWDIKPNTKVVNFFYNTDGTTNRNKDTKSKVFEIPQP